MTTTVTFVGLGQSAAGTTHATTTTAPASPPVQQAPNHAGAAVGLSLSIGMTALIIGVVLKFMGRTSWVAAFVWVVVGATSTTIAATATGLFSSGLSAVNDSANHSGPAPASSTDGR